MALLEGASARGTTVVVATHDRALLARHKKRVIALEGGRVVSGGEAGRRAASA
jgi:cell division transport system ATP-binding protein